MMNQSKVPTSAQYTVEEYLTEREMSNLPVLLVEGDDDSVIFQLLQDEVLNNGAASTINFFKNLEIDTTAIILSPTDNILGNRSKVEYVCNIADTYQFKGRLTGFVDREFREFDVFDRVIDKLQCHNKVGRVLWSRGHSIENYLLDWSIVRDELREYGVNPHFSIGEALALLEANFSPVLKHATAISLAAKEYGHLSFIPRTFDSSLFYFENELLKFDLEKWSCLMQNRQKLDKQRRDDLISGFRKYISVVDATPDNVVRWVCHGHVGMSFLWEAFQACVFQIGSQRQVNNPHRITSAPNEHDQMKKFAVAWIRYQLLQTDDSDSLLTCFNITTLQACHNSQSSVANC